MGCAWQRSASMMWIRLTCWGHYFDLTVWRVGLNGAAGTLELGQCEWWPMEGSKPETCRQGTQHCPGCQESPGMNLWFGQDCGG